MSRVFAFSSFLTLLLGALPLAAQETEPADPPASDTAAEPGSPQDVVGKFVKAAKDRDKDAMLALLAATADEKELFVAVIDLAVAAEEFKQAMIDKYEEAGWEEFNDKEGANLNTTFNIVDGIDQIKIEEDGDKATAKIPGQDKPLVLVKKDGKWLISAKETITLTGGTDAAQVAKTLNELTKIVKKYQGKIGMEKVTAESIDQEMGAEFLKVLLGS